MLTGGLVAKKYFSPAEPTFWHWDDDAEAVLNADGQVIAFRMELAETLERIGGDGLPPMGALLLALLATKKSWRHDLRTRMFHGVIQEHEGHGRYLPNGLLVAVENKLADFHGVVVAFSDRELVSTALEIVFEGCITEVPADGAGEAIETLRAGPSPDMLAGERSRDAFDRMLLDLRTLDAGLGRATHDAIRRRRRTGIDQEVEPLEAPELPLPAHESALALIDELERHDQHAPLGKLARQLLPAVRPPRGLGHPRDLPLGGLNDITNRGQLDRLLISELAQDDLTLAVRIANNEALYLRREESHVRPLRQRHVLVDVGLHQWGVPRLISAAAALALCAAGDNRVELSCWCATHDDAQPISPFTSEGFEDLLARLEVNLSPAAAVDRLADDVADQAAAELVVVLSRSTVRDADLHRALRRFAPNPVYLVAIDRSGRVEVLACTDKGLRPHNQTHVEVEQLINHRLPDRVPLVDVARSSDLPAAIRQRRLPLRVPSPLVPGSAWVGHTDGRVYAVTRDHRLTLWDSPRHGPLQLSDDLPAAAVLWHSHPNAVDPIDALIGRVGHAAEVYALSIDHDEHTVHCNRLELPGEDDLVGVTFHRGVVIAASRTTAYAIDPATGRVLTERVIREDRVVKEMRGRFVRLSNHSWLALGYTGSSFITVPIEMPRGPMQSLGVAGVFESQGTEGFVIVTQGGDVMTAYGGEQQTLLKAKPGSLVTRVMWSGDGGRLIVQRRERVGMSTYDVIEIDAGQAKIIHQSRRFPGDVWLRPAIQKACLNRSPRVKYLGVHLSRDPLGKPVLRLIVSSGRALLMRPHPTTGIDLIDIGSVPPREQIKTFKPIPSPPGTRYKLSAADFGEGGRVVADSRAMLHLQPRDKALTEATLVIENERVSGWCSDGRVFGSPYYSHPSGGVVVHLEGHVAYRSVIEPILEQMG